MRHDLELTDGKTALEFTPQSDVCGDRPSLWACRSSALQVSASPSARGRFAHRRCWRGNRHSAHGRSIGGEHFASGIVDAAARTVRSAGTQSFDVRRHGHLDHRIQCAGCERHGAAYGLRRPAAEYCRHQRQRTRHSPNQCRLHHAGQESHPTVGRSHPARPRLRHSYASGLGSAALHAGARGVFETTAA